MTENKRFTVKQRQGATIYSIIDYYGKLPLSEGMYYKSNAEKLCKWLNTQHELLNAFCKENEQLKSFKQRVFDLIDKTIEEETQIAENIEEVTQETRPYAKAVNRITIKTLENLKWELQE